MANEELKIFKFFLILVGVLSSVGTIPIEEVQFENLADISIPNDGKAAIILSGRSLVLGSHGSDQPQELIQAQSPQESVVEPNEDDLDASGDQGLPNEEISPPSIILNSQENILEDTVQQEDQNNGMEIITSNPNEDENQTEANTNPVTTLSPEIKDTTEAINLPECLTNNTLPNPQDCHQYFLCAFTAEETLNALPMSCPPSKAYNSKYQRCTRDLSDCNDGMVCNVAGTFPVSSDNTTYWWCTPALDGGFHKFLVQCPKYEFYTPEINGCFYDLQNLPTTFILNEPKDIDAIKLELKQFKLEEKERLKAEKMKAKLAKKYQKLLEKQVKKEAKEKEKLLGSEEV